MLYIQAWLIGQWRVRPGLLVSIEQGRQVTSGFHGQPGSNPTDRDGGLAASHTSGFRSYPGYGSAEADEPHDAHAGVPGGSQW